MERESIERRKERHWRGEEERGGRATKRGKDRDSVAVVPFVIITRDPIHLIRG